MHLNTKISKLRKSKGWNKKQLADKLGLSAMTISKYENELNPMIPSSRVLVNIAKLFGISIYDLTGVNIDSKPIHEGKALKQWLSDEGYNIKQLAISLNISRNELYYNFDKEIITQQWMDKINSIGILKISKVKFIKAYIKSSV